MNSGSWFEMTTTISCQVHGALPLRLAKFLNWSCFFTAAKELVACRFLSPNKCFKLSSSWCRPFKRMLLNIIEEYSKVFS